MDRPRIVGLLRITFSTVCGTICLLLIALSVRSLTWADQYGVRISPTYHLMINSQLGGMSCYLDNSPRVITTTRLVDTLYPDGQKPQMLGRVYFIHGQIGGGAPYWLLALASAFTAALPWKPWKWKFSLRTLLIATTLVAVVLGLAVAFR
jgi:hypothetical protein